MVKPLTLLSDLVPPSSCPHECQLMPPFSKLPMALCFLNSPSGTIQQNKLWNYCTLPWKSTLMPHFPLHPYRLTAFVTKCFDQAQRFIFIDDRNVQDALRWMAGNQLSNGCYANVGELIHTTMKVRTCPGAHSPLLCLGGTCTSE